jgi:hypothetical protein
MNKAPQQSHGSPGRGVNLEAESVAGEEDPGASLDMPPDSGAAQRQAPFSPKATMNPGDEAPPGTPGTGETLCRDCGGTGRTGSGPCATCGGTGKVTAGLGGG